MSKEPDYTDFTGDSEQHSEDIQFSRRGFLAAGGGGLAGLVAGTSGMAAGLKRAYPDEEEEECLNLSIRKEVLRNYEVLDDQTLDEEEDMYVNFRYDEDTDSWLIEGRDDVGSVEVENIDNILSDNEVDKENNEWGDDIFYDC